jgi:tetratricopeptide (TPR) repeat protein
MEAARALVVAVTLLVGGALAPSAVGAVTPPTAGPVGEAWALFSAFHEDLARIDRSRALLEDAVRREPSLEALLLLSWVHLTWADLRAGTPDEKLAGYERGRDIARRAIELAPRNPEAHLWYAANLGRWAIARGKLRAAFLLGTMEEEIQTILTLDPNHVAGLSLAASFYLETPRLLGGDVAKAETYARKALALDAHFTRARVELARALIEQQRYGEARRELQQIVDEPRPSYVADWAVRHRPRARRLLDQIRDRS